MGRSIVLSSKDVPEIFSILSAKKLRYLKERRKPRSITTLKIITDFDILVLFLKYSIPRPHKYDRSMDITSRIRYFGSPHE